jgi:metallo-beta-lactamase family protein
LKLTIYGAAEEVTGSCYLIECGSKKILLECGLFQGGSEQERRNWDAFPFAIEQIDAVVISHAHIDHSGRVPLLVKRGYSGPIYTHPACKALCDIMLQDSAYLNKKDAEWENKRRKNSENPVEPLYDVEDALNAIELFEGTQYDTIEEILPGIRLRFSDAGHILGSSIVELWHEEAGKTSKLVFSGDLGYRHSPVMRDHAIIESADLVLMESTYGDRQHRAYEATLTELSEVFEAASAGGGNILIPAFAVGRTQDLLYLLSQHYQEWGLNNWTVFLDSPMAIRSTETYAQFQDLYDVPLFNRAGETPGLPNLILTRTTEESIAINRVRSGAIIIAGSGMCTGGRIRQHIKTNISREETHLVIIGFQAYGTLGRRLVDGADTINLWGDEYPVRARIHTVGGLSAHGDQADLLQWYGHFKDAPPVVLVHGEQSAQKTLAQELRKQYGVAAQIGKYAQSFIVN